MGELAIKTHDFEEAKLAIKKFSEETTTNLQLQTVDDKKGVGEWLVDALFGGGLGINHTVTGKELNDLTSQIQQHLLGLNGTQVKLIKQFGQVYGALEALDKDYIQWIVASIKATEIATERIEVDNKKINKLQANQKKSLEKLQQFKQKMDSYTHLKDVDQLWDDCQKWRDEIPALSSAVASAVASATENTASIEGISASIDGVRTTITQLSSRIDEQICHIQTLTSFLDELNAIAHLSDVDTMWEHLSFSLTTLEILRKEINTAKIVATNQEKEIEQILVFVDELSHYDHLKDIDFLWESINTHSQQIAELTQQNKETQTLIDQNKEQNDQALVEEKDNITIIVQQLNKKIQYAYWIAGGSAALALIELFAILLG